MSQLRVGINGFGRIGRLILRAGWKKIKIAGINNLSSIESSAHLLKYDSVHGPFEEKVHASKDKIYVRGEEIGYSSFKDPAQIPWNKWDVDIVFECTGVFKKREEVLKHIESCSKESDKDTREKQPTKLQNSQREKRERKVLVSAPFKEADGTFVFGVNHKDFDFEKHSILSNASCTTNCLAPLVSVLEEHFPLEWGFMTTIHSYTNDQRILDASHKDLRRARAGALSMIPTNTGATQAVAQVLPQLKGRLKGMAVRVPTPNVSLVDLVFSSKKALSVESLHKVLKEAECSHLKGILRCEELPLVSSDFMTSSYSCIVDLPSTMVLGSHTAKIIAWYDNEMGFSHRMIDLALYMHSREFSFKSEEKKK